MLEKHRFVRPSQYEVIRLLASGGMSRVYLAKQTRLGRLVALKVMLPSPSEVDDNPAEGRFWSEAQTLVQLKHPHIVVAHDYGRTPDGSFYLAMEYIDGPRLTDVLKEGPLDAVYAVRLALQIGSGLRYAHNNNIVHRDLKPSNILIRRCEGELDHVKIIDFGLVKRIEDDQTLTHEGTILGSPLCMAPEQARANPIDPRTDIYSFGIVLFRMLTGRYPFSKPESLATMIAHVEDEVPSFSNIAPLLQFPSGIERVVRRCLQKKPKHRFQTMQEVIDALVPYANHSSDDFRFASFSSPISRPEWSNAPPLTMTRSDLWNRGALLVALGAFVALLTVFVTVVSVGIVLRAWDPTVPASVPSPTAPERAEEGLVPLPPPDEAEAAGRASAPGEAPSAEEAAAAPSPDVAPAPSPTRRAAPRPAPVRSSTPAVAPPAPDADAEGAVTEGEPEANGASDPPPEAPATKKSKRRYLDMPSDLME